MDKLLKHQTLFNSKFTQGDPTKAAALSSHLKFRNGSLSKKVNHEQVAGVPVGMN